MTHSPLNNGLEKDIMTVSTDNAVLPLRVAELMCSRLCHDLISPAAAVSNGLELLDDGQGGMDQEVMSLLTFSVGQAAGKLMYFRMAYGLGGDNADALTQSDAVNLIRGVVEEDKISLDLQDGDTPLGRDATKLLLNAALVGLETLPNRGKLSISVERDPALKITIAGDGEGVAVRPEVREVLTADADVMALTPRTVQAYFTSWLALTLGGSFVLQSEKPSHVLFEAQVPAAG
jgi:histidine phosphotransferase ChpT